MESLSNKKSKPRSGPELDSFLSLSVLFRQVAGTVLRIVRAGYEESGHLVPGPGLGGEELVPPDQPDEKVDSAAENAEGYPVGEECLLKFKLRRRYPVIVKQVRHGQVDGRVEGEVSGQVEEDTRNHDFNTCWSCLIRWTFASAGMTP